MDVTAASAPTEVELSLYASWSRRAGAWLVDATLLGLVTIAAARVSEAAAVLAILVLPAAYATFCNGGRNGQTVGKWVLNVSVRNAASLGRLGYGAAFVRWTATVVLRVLLFLPGVLDALSPLWDRRRQAWHDKAAGSVVVLL